MIADAFLFQIIIKGRKFSKKITFTTPLLKQSQQPDIFPQTNSIDFSFFNNKRFKKSCHNDDEDDDGCLMNKEMKCHDQPFLHILLLPSVISNNKSTSYPKANWNLYIQLVIFTQDVSVSDEMREWVSKRGGNFDF